MESEAAQTAPRHVELKGLFCSFQSYVEELYAGNCCNVRCNFRAALSQISFPTEGAPDYAVKVWRAFMTLAGWVGQYLLDCICHTLLVSCSTCGPDDRVVVACLTLEGKVITGICNLVRRWRPAPLVSHLADLQTLKDPFFPVIKGWLAKWDDSVPLEDALENLCCEQDATTVLLDAGPANWPEFASKLAAAKKRIQDSYAKVRG